MYIQYFPWYYVSSVIFFLSTQHYVRKGVDEDAAVSLYYERLAAVQARGEQSTHQVLRDIFKEVGFIR